MTAKLEKIKLIITHCRFIRCTCTVTNPEGILLLSPTKVCPMGRKPKTLKCLMSPLQRNYYRNLKETEVNTRRVSGTSVKIS
jgi:hypothetical protein